MHRKRIKRGKRGELLLFTSYTYVDVGFFTKINRKHKNHKAILSQGLVFEPSGHALPGAEEPYLVVLGITPDSVFQAYFKTSLKIDFSNFSPICTQLSFSFLTQLLQIDKLTNI